MTKNMDAVPPADVSADETGKVSRRSLLMGSAGVALASAALSATPALANHDHPVAHSSGVSPSGSLSSRIYAVVDGVADIARMPTDIPPPIARREPETVSVELETIELEARLDGRTTFRYWTFNGTVPGPFVRVRVGDTVEVSLKNADDSSMMHNVDFHAVTGPGGGAEATSAAPGETKGFTFKALNPGLYVYHCAVPPVAMHIANGMYGLILVEPEDGLPPVDREFYVMQGEIYTEEEFGSSGLLTESYEKLLNERPEYFVLNGHVGALTDHYPLKANVGETVRIYFGVGGPNFTSSFHVIGEIFDKVYQLGSVTSPPLTDVQTVSVPAGGATIVEFKVEVPGRYVLVDHALSRVERGLAGFLIVEGDENPEIFNAHDH
ncbi:copper-containing nitrite reductase [Aquamicrobium zhengzhouense]|jgi:nitrite reductase (NO-forming)|uniref:Copper-containing nitrite reductase n=1 Tax=Aquamicrobium zhengzhouense TaxID=2781738 RepID=A0ABS0SH77_9HYPH|nr:copper-containing nitrite reductase [Aquamicrobium zhengzhouense]MBI1622591.1 nitrite reductase, copper-containing [Aquamicrobium zhengzhouense]